MKIILKTTLCITVLAIGLFGINHSSNGSNNIGKAFAQENDTMSMENDPSMMMNATLPI